MKAKSKIIIAAITFLVVIVTLISTSIGTTGTFYMTVDELVVNKAKAEGKPIKVSGKIVGDSIKWEPDKILLSFDLEGESNEIISVHYEGVKPDSMNDGWEAIVEGELTSNGTIIASELLVKCPSKYEAMEEDGEEIPEDHLPLDQQQERSYE